MTEEILDLLRGGGAHAYFGESVTQLEHALQAAALAEAAGATTDLIVAALLHDVGHLLHHRSENISAQGIDAHHEDVGHWWLSQHFGPSVTGPIRLHVAAKRCLCAIDPAYYRSLSPASRESLALQGGPMSREQASEFRQQRWSGDALALRRWDDAAKVPGLPVPGLLHCQSRVEALLESR